MSGQMIDWDLAVGAAARLAGQGPTVSRTEADEVVAELRAGAARSTPLVREFTGLAAEAGTAPVLVVDRRAGSRPTPTRSPRSSARSSTSSRSGAAHPVGGLTEAVGSRVTGLEVGALLGFLAGKVLGQFDPFHAPADSGTSAGRLLLVAPNIVHAERELGADPTDFRLWVCLHEETHRVQFTAVPWMRDHLQAQIDTLVERRRRRPRRGSPRCSSTALRRAGDLVSGRGDASLIDLFATPAQREVIDRVTGVMSLLEGHADVVMDGVGPEVIPTVDEIRRRFNQRRKGAGSLDRLARRLLGLDAKMAQYRDGAHFVRTVVERGRHGGLQQGVGRARPTCRPRPRSATRRPGSAGSTAEPLMGPDPAVAAVRLAARSALAVRRCARRPAAPARSSGRLLRRRRLAGAARRDRLRVARRGRWPVVGATVDHGLQEGSAERADTGGRADGGARRRRDR